MSDKSEKARNVKQITIFPRSFYVRWINERFDKNYESVTDLKDGCIYLELLCKLFPDDVDDSSVTKSPKRNWKNIDYYLRALNIVKTIKFQELLAGEEREHLFFVAWFKSFYEINESNTQKLDYLMQWVHLESGMKADQLEDLSDALIYSILMRKLYPKSIDMTKIQISNCSTEACKRNNWKVLYEAFQRVRIKTEIPIKAIINFDLNACFRFLVIFKDFYDQRSEVRLTKSVAQKEYAEMMLKIVEASTEVQRGWKLFQTELASLLIKIGESMKTVKKTNPLTSRLFTVLREMYGKIVYPSDEPYLAYKSKPLNHLHDLITMSMNVDSIHKADPKLISSEIQRVTGVVITSYTSLYKLLIRIIHDTYDLLEEVKVHREHTLKDLFYSMKYKFMTAKKVADDFISTRQTTKTDGRVVKMVYLLLEANQMAENIKDLVDCMQRKRKTK